MFRPLIRYPDYEVNEYGDVRRIGSNVILKPYLVNGHPKIKLKGRTEYVGRLVAETFIENHYGFSDVRHLDGDKTNNHISNLQWVSHSVTQKDSYGLGINAPGGNQPPKQIIVFETGVVYPSIKACARDIGGSPSGIRKCLRGEYNTYCGYHLGLYPSQE